MLYIYMILSCCHHVRQPVRCMFQKLQQPSSSIPATSGPVRLGKSEAQRPALRCEQCSGYSGGATQKPNSGTSTGDITLAWFGMSYPETLNKIPCNCKQGIRSSRSGSPITTRARDQRGPDAAWRALAPAGGPATSFWSSCDRTEVIQTHFMNLNNELVWSKNAHCFVLICNRSWEVNSHRFSCKSM